LEKGALLPGCYNVANIKLTYIYDISVQIEFEQIKQAKQNSKLSPIYIYIYAAISYVCCIGIGGECAGELFLKLFLFKNILK